MSFLKPVYLGSAFAAAGAFMLLFSKKGNVRSVGEVLAGFGVLFLGLSQMPDAVKPLTELPSVQNMFVTFGNNPLLALLVGIAVTAVIQSSTASIGILQSMAVMGVIPWSAAVFIVLGQNVGTCFTTMLTSIGANRNTKAASFVHFVYNAMGAFVFFFIAFVFFTFIQPEFGAEAASATHVSIIHTGYNIFKLGLLFPLGNVIMKIALMMAGKEKPEITDDKCNLTELDESILETPSYALENIIKAMNKLTVLLRANIKLSANIFTNKKLLKTELKNFHENAESADKANVTIRSFLTKLYGEEISDSEHVFVATLLHNLTRLERINDHTKGIVKKAEELNEGGLSYSAEIIALLQDLSEKATACYDEAVAAFMQNKHVDITDISDEVLAMYEHCKAHHLDRISSGFYGEHGIQSGIVFLEAVRHISRIASNSKSIAETAHPEHLSA
jgi:phosphate:Na+ symporter